MSMISKNLMRHLARSRLMAHQATASTGIGERASRNKGLGIEFADHRAYQMGDDIRHVDQHVHGRLGEYYVREYSLYQQLAVVILIDASRSMQFGSPTKLRAASSLAAALGYVALAGGDRLQLGAINGYQTEWSQRFEGIWRAPGLFSWLDQLRPRGETHVARALKMILPRLKPPGLLIIVSDWMFDDTDEALATLATARQEVIGVQVLSPEELDPSEFGSGLVRMVDAETGHEVEVGLDASAAQQYLAELEAWQQRLRTQHLRRGWRFLEVRSDDDLERVVGVEWRRLGVIT